MPPNKPSRRRYPRASVQIKARLSSTGAAEGSRFEATLSTSDISVGGIFFASTFFLKAGQQVEVELTLPPTQRRVRARGRIIRIEEGRRSEGRSGFAVKFTEYLDHSEVVLANYFLAPVLRKFVQDYVHKSSLKTHANYVENAVDLLAAWELRKSAAGTVDVSLWGEEA